jgi:N-acetylmuramoyl-L-alanine amidase
MRCSRAFCFVLSILAFITLCAAGRSPSSHGVQGSYEASSITSPNALKPLIILDAGHGGTDEGAKVNTLMEKKISLTTALLTKQHLQELGYRVIMTRNRDVFLPLPRRVSIANKTKGSLFVSVHFNSSPSVEAQGVEIFYYDSKEMWRTRASKRLASCILHRVIDQTDATSRGIKQGNFHVIRETDMPAVLVEGGFITNRDERGKLRDREYLDRLAVGIAQGIDKYMKM